ncbi:uncharacterized protein M6B38_338380 [Iris pallida]|uniref:Uncharacterized protein n=1 Tax=Iris pallida TaxID=29817 RepID=A0AAX6GY77_IRIPA|nr:uncharacterized protein M6B38_338380 [Iris pallida]
MLVYNSVKARRAYNHHHHSPLRSRKPDPPPFDERAGSGHPAAEPASKPASNLGRFLDSTTPSVPAHNLPKMKMRGWRSCDVEYRPYFSLGDLWESFKEWSAYGAGVPLLLDDGSDCVVQYYVPYLSGLQLYGHSCLPALRLGQCGEESDGDSYMDSSSDGSSDSEPVRGLKSKAWSRSRLSTTSMLRMKRLSLSENPAHLQEEFSSDDGEDGNSEGCLLFEYLEQDPPHCREPLADKANFRSCRLLPRTKDP